MKWFKQKRILVPFDFSEESTSAVEVALELAPSADEVHVVHIIPDLVATEPGVIWDTINDEERKSHAQAEMEKSLAAHHGIHLDVGVGDAGHVVVDLADEIEAGLIVIPSHGRRGLSRMFLGSVAERVVRYAHCPVLVLKKPVE
ncbi:MAG: universal stress protein [Pirellulaceae bacterium]